MLMQVDLDTQIPHELYLAVAELLAWLYRLEHGRNQETAAPIFDFPTGEEKSTAN